MRSSGRAEIMSVCPKGKVPFATLEGAKIAAAAIAKRAHEDAQRLKARTGQKTERAKVRSYISCLSGLNIRTP